MAELNEIYNSRIIELAAAIAGPKKLDNPDATSTQHSKLCGSTVTVELKMRNGVVSEYAQTVKACLLGQASAAVMGREIVGSTPAELRAVGAAMRAMLKGSGEPPSGRWIDLTVLEPVRAVKARHASTLLVFDAVEKALQAIEERHRAGPVATVQ
jgi:NifU-like protein involved in Fe-S cluster formation